MHWATMAYISPPGRNIVIWGFKRHSEIMLFILLYKNICKFGAKRPERAVSRLHERFRSPPPPLFLPPTPLLGITYPMSSRPTSIPQPPPPPPPFPPSPSSLALAERSHACKWAPWLAGLAVGGLPGGSAN